MARYSRIEVALRMRETGIVPLFYHPDIEICKSVVKALYEGGMRLFEFTNRGDFAHEVFSDLNKYALKELPGMILGVGSVMDGATASLYIQSGANFIVSPVLKEDIAIACNRRKILWAPGCGTVTEISRAEELGAELIKIFPAPSVGGPEFVKSVTGPMPWSHIMPSGGVEPNKESLKKWFDAGSYCVGMGSNLVTKEIIKKTDFELLRKVAGQVLEMVKEVRKQD